MCNIHKKDIFSFEWLGVFKCVIFFSFGRGFWKTYVWGVRFKRVLQKIDLNFHPIDGFFFQDKSVNIWFVLVWYLCCFENFEQMNLEFLQVKTGVRFLFVLRKVSQMRGGILYFFRWFLWWCCLWRLSDFQHAKKQIVIDYARAPKIVTMAFHLCFWKTFWAVIQFRRIIFKCLFLWLNKKVVKSKTITWWFLTHKVYTCILKNL